MTNEEIKNYPEGTKIKVYIPEVDRKAWKGKQYLEGFLTFQRINKETIETLEKIQAKEWYYLCQEDRDFYEEFNDEKTYGIEYIQPFNKRFEQFTIKKGTECVCYQYEAERFRIIEDGKKSAIDIQEDNYTNW